MGDDFVVSSGPLRIKGAKIEKKKKKKSKKNLAKALSTGESPAAAGGGSLGPGYDNEEDNDEMGRSIREGINGDERRRKDGGEDEGETEHRGEKERGGCGEEEDEVNIDEFKTEAERKHEETVRKRLLKLASQPNGRPELLKTHKQRVEELNTYLSKLSEHHDMPKIGPG